MYEFSVFLFAYFQLRSFQSMSHYYHSRTKLSNGFLLFVLVRIFYIYPVLYFKKIISWLNTIKLWFLSIILLYFKMDWNMRPYCKHCIYCKVCSPLLNNSISTPISSLSPNRRSKKQARIVPNNMIINLTF